MAGTGWAAVGRTQYGLAAVTALRCSDCLMNGRCQRLGQSSAAAQSAGGKVRAA
jgi:hypothetical protein